MRATLLQVAARYEQEGADELVFLDITASHEEREILLDVVRRTAEVIFMPLTVGGGIRTSLDDIRTLLKCGLRQGVDQPWRRSKTLISLARRPCGSAANVSSSISILKASCRDGVEVWEVFINGGRISTGLEAVAWARRVEDLGAGEIVLTSMDADGTKNGYDLEITRAVAETVGIPVVASGGAGSPEHFYEAFVTGKASAALAASIFHYGEYSIPETKRYLAGRGVPVRLSGFAAAEIITDRCQRCPIGFGTWAASFSTRRSRHS